MPRCYAATLPQPKGETALVEALEPSSLIESAPLSKLVLKIDFIKPMEGHHTIDFTLLQQGDAIIVTQAMQGPNPYLNRLMTIFFSMDKMMGKKFEEGLANLKSIAEK